MLLRDIERQRDRLLIALWLGGEVNVKDLEAIITPKYLPNLLYRVNEGGLIKRKGYEGLRTVCLSDKGIDFVCRKHLLFAKDSPAGNLYDRSSKKEESTRKQRRARGFIGFSNAGVKITDDISKITRQVETPVYIDSFEMKRNMGPEVQGSRISGIYVTSNEVFRVYPAEGIFQIFSSIEDRMFLRLKNSLMRNNPASETINDIVLCPGIKEIISFINNEQGSSQLEAKSYKITASDTNKYYIPCDNSELMIKLISNPKLRNEYLNTVMSTAFDCTIKNSDFTEYEDGYIISILDLNLGTIKKIYDYISNKNNKPVTVVWLEEYTDVFTVLFQGKVKHKVVSREQLLKIMDIKEE